MLQSSNGAAVVVPAPESVTRFFFIWLLDARYAFFVRVIEGRKGAKYNVALCKTSFHKVGSTKRDRLKTQRLFSARFSLTLCGIIPVSSSSPRVSMTRPWMQGRTLGGNKKKQAAFKAVHSTPVYRSFALCLACGFCMEDRCDGL